MLISENYRALQSKLHENPSYGVASLAYAPLVAKYVRLTNERQILDYGCGKGRLAQALQLQIPWSLTINCYDPAIPHWSKSPDPCVFVACIDVLEHIEPECLDAVLDDLQRVSIKWGFFTVHCGAAIKILADGRNAHLTQQPPGWWIPKIANYFVIVEQALAHGGFWVFVKAV